MKTIQNPCYHCYAGAVGDCGCTFRFESWAQDLEAETVEVGGTHYVLVSQGFEIFRTRDREEAMEQARKSNASFARYAQECYDRGEAPADNEVFLYEEDENGNAVEIKL